MLTISTFNIQNKESKTKAIDILKYIEENKIDIINLQELYPSCEKELRKSLKDYKITGKYRYLYFPKINESNPIITNKDIIYTKTYSLPHLPSLLNRIITKTVISIDNKQITILNTHLDYKYQLAKKRQLQVILKLLKKETNPVILTGDFNLKNNKELFNNFVKDLEQLNIHHVEIEEKTLKTSKYKRAIDHIFLSNDFKLIDKKVIKTIETSDHYPILIKVILNK